MKSIKGIFIFLILSVLCFDVHADGLANSDFDVDLKIHLKKKKLLVFINWSAAYYNTDDFPNGPIKLEATCGNIQKNSVHLQGNDFLTTSRKNSFLPATGYTQTDYMDGTIFCNKNDVITIRPTITVAGQTGSLNSNNDALDRPFQLYQSLKPVKTDENSNPVLGWECTAPYYYWAYIMYMPAGKYDQPSNPDPNGHYALFGGCRR